jgi:large subunit ribosomal protein L35
MRKKLKTHRGAAKRFSKTGSGLLIRKRSGKRHLLAHKSAKRKRNMGNLTPLTKGDGAAIKHLLPYV